MKKIFLVFTAFLSCLSLSAQCPFNPTVVNGNVALCPSQSDTLSTQTAGSYQWYKNGNPIIGANQQTLTINQVQDAGASFLVVSTINNCTEPSPAIQVTSITVPSISFQVANSPDNTACIGNEIQLDVLPIFDTNLKWFRNGVQIPGQFSDSLLAVSSGAYAVSGAIAQCPNTLRLSGTTNLNFINSEVPIVSENTQTLSLSTSVIAPQYQWYLNDVVLQNAIQSILVPSQNGSYKVEAIYSQGCSKQSEPYLFNGIFVDCPFDPVINPNNIILCPEKDDTLSTISAEFYQWFRDGNPIQEATQQELIVDYFNSAGSNFSVDVTIDGCTERSADVLVDGWVFLPVTVATLSDIPLADLCEGDSVYLQLNPPYENDIIWTKNNIVIENETDDSLLITNSGVYSVVGFTETCPDFGGESVPIDMVFKPAPVPQIFFAPNSNTISTTAENVSVFTWFIDGIINEQFTSSSFEVPIDGNYNLNVQYNNGCEAMSTILEVIVIGIAEMKNTSLQVFPNPFSNSLQFINESNNIIKAELFSSDGKLITAKSINGYETIDTSSLTSGFYLLKVTQQNNNFTYKLVK
jgi:large repetitive protein